MTALRHLVARVAISPSSTVLLTGESGTGKDLVAKIIHYTSDRASRPFMNITCSALPEQLLESELFGHERGAFTDARMQKKGLLETADGGTVFLDEISEMTPALQAKLLRFLEEKSFKRVGGARTSTSTCRVIAASNRNLEEEVGKSQFRSDLYYRLNVLPITMPSLRSHAEDIPLLVEYFIDGFNGEFRKKVMGRPPRRTRRSSSTAGRATSANCATSSSAPCCSRITIAWTRRTSRRCPAGDAGDEFELPAKGVDLEQLERSLLVQALKRSGGNQTRAGALLGLNRDQIRYRIEKFALTTAP